MSFFDSVKAKYNALPPKSRKTARILGIFLLLVLLAMIMHACSGPAQAQLVGRGPEPVHIVALTIQTVDGRRVAGMQVAVLPPIGYEFVEGKARWRIVGGEFGAPSCSATRCGIRATALVEPAN